MSVKTQGTHIYVLDEITSSEPAVIKMACPTSASGLGGAADQIDTTCLDDLIDRAFTRGLGNPGQVSIPFILKPSEASHQSLFDFKDDGSTMHWIICLSDGTADPTAASEGFNPPAGRTSLAFQAYVSDINIDLETNEVVRGTLTLQRSGAVTPTWKS